MNPNFITEEDARKKQCRIVGAIVSGPQQVQTKLGPQMTQPQVGYHKCAGADCGHWCWVGQYPVNGGKNDEAHGYCGLKFFPVEETRYEAAPSTPVIPDIAETPEAPE